MRVSVAASGSVAVNAALVGNVIVNTIDAEIADSVVHSTGGAVDVGRVGRKHALGQRFVVGLRARRDDKRPGAD